MEEKIPPFTNPEGVVVTEADNSVYPLEILYYGKTEHKEEIGPMFEKLQACIERNKGTRYVRVFYYFHDQQSDDEMKDWLIKNSKCKYYIFLNDHLDGFTFSQKYITDLVNTIKDRIALSKRASTIKLQMDKVGIQTYQPK